MTDLCYNPTMPNNNMTQSSSEKFYIPHFTLHFPKSEELRFLITFCQMQPDIEKITSQMKNEKLKIKNWQEIVSISSHHGVLPLVYKALRNLTEIQTSDSSINAERLTLNAYLAEFKSAYMQIVQRNILMSAELLRIMKLLRENNIPALTFKGPTLAQTAYEDITLRQYSDLDILVDEKEIFHAGSLLSEHGYAPAFPLKILKNRTCLSVTNDLAFYNRSNGTVIELHWKLFREKIGENLGFAQISENRQTTSINSQPLPTLSIEMLLAYLCLHGSKHAWERLEWICDIDRLIRINTDLDWQKTVNIAKKMDTLTTLHLGLALSHTLFHTPIPENMVSYIQTERIKKLVAKTFELLDGILSEEESYAKYRAIHTYQTNLLDTKSKQLKHLFSTYFGISQNDCRQFPLPPSLKFLYLFIKPFRVLIKYIQYGK